MYKGSCLCGTVRYEIDASLGPAVYCHCQRCRKAGGSAFASNAVVPAAAFRFVQGESAVRTFSTDQGVHRLFCSQCGSPLISRRDNTPDIVRVRLGTLDDTITERPQAHIYVGSKAEWHTITDTLPQHQERPPA